MLLSHTIRSLPLLLSHCKSVDPGADVLPAFGYDGSCQGGLCAAFHTIRSLPLLLSHCKSVDPRADVLPAFGYDSRSTYLVYYSL